MGYTPHVLVIGGGVLGTAITRDLAIRGVEVTLLEQGTLAAGASGRMQGVLYSGARFAGRDPGGATRCHRESHVLQRIADEYVREMGGVVVAPQGEEEQLDDLLAAVEECNIRATELSGDKLQEEAPVLSEEISRGLRVPDAAVDPFLLTIANARSAKSYGAEIRTGTEVTDLRFADGRVAGATVHVDGEPDQDHPQPGDRSGVDAPDEAELAGNPDTEQEDASENEEPKAPEPVGEIQRSFPGASESTEPEPGSTEEIEADFVVNATGAWADRIAAMAGIDLSLSRARGTMVVLEGEQSDSVVSLYDDAGADRQLTPFWGNTVLGRVTEPFEEAGEVSDAATKLLDETSAAFDLGGLSVLRSYTGLWTTHPGSESPPEGPGATIVDHKRHHDRWGMLTVVGGTLTTHRAVAESVVDRICREFGIHRGCRTDEISLPSVEPGSGTISGPAATATGRASQAVSSITNRGSGANPVLCEDREVRRNSVQQALDAASSRDMDLTEVRLRTGATMGRCQGGRCGHRLGAQLYPDEDAETVEQSLEAFLQRRWAGRREALWGDQLAQAMADYEFHSRVLNRDGVVPEDLTEFEDVTDDDPEQRYPPCCEAVHS